MTDPPGMTARAVAADFVGRRCRGQLDKRYTALYYAALASQVARDDMLAEMEPSRPDIEVSRRRAFRPRVARST